MNIRIHCVRWQDQQQQLLAIRHRVFVEEQGVPTELEEDNHDATAIHFLGMNENEPIACARLLPDGHFGRVAVLSRYRNSGIGRELLKTISEMALNMGMKRIEAEMQCNAVGFYLRNGFTTTPGFFMDAGIPHIHMHKTLPDETPKHQQPEQSSTQSASSHMPYVLRHDNQTHTLTEPIERLGCLQILIAQRPFSLDLLLTDPNDLIWSHPGTAEGLRLFIRSNRRTTVRLLLKQEHPHLLGHPLIRLAQRTSSRIQLRINTSMTISGAVCGPCAWLLDRDIRHLDRKENTRHQWYANFNNPGESRTLAEQVERLWQEGNSSNELRALLL
jgi:predicted GNAT family N-acyltransferase